MHRIEMRVSEQILEQFKDVFDLEIDLLKGDVKERPDGLFDIIIEVNDERARMFKDFISMMASLPTTKVKVSICGQLINPN